MTSQDWADLAEMVDKATAGMMGNVISGTVLADLLREKAESVSLGESLDESEALSQTQNRVDRLETRVADLEGGRR